MSYEERDHLTEIDISLEQEVFENRELERSHNRYLNELRFMNLVKDGNIDQMRKELADYNFDEAGRMSGNPYRQILFLFISSITLATRFAMEGGLGEEDAYHLSDIYIQKADQCTNINELKKLYVQMLLDFTCRVFDLKKAPTVSYEIQLAKDYIFSHLHYHISLKSLSNEIGFCETYLSYLFKKETGVTITEFIHKKRVAEAENLLRYSDFSISVIGHSLGFCSQSHFTSVFQKYNGMTPSAFRKLHFRKKWDLTVSHS